MALRNTNKDLILLTSCHPYSFIIQKFLYSSFLGFPLKYIESSCYYAHCNHIVDLSTQEDYFSR